MKLTGNKGAIAAGGKGSATVGLGILKKGGNAVDAGIATVLALSVTDRQTIGGEVAILISPAETGKVVAINGQGPAPKKATSEYFRDIGGIPPTGILPAAIPGMFSACLLALEEYGTMSFAQIAKPTIDMINNIDEEWFSVRYDLEDKEWLPRLANTLRRLVKAESTPSTGDRSKALKCVHDYFYDGPIARELVEWSSDRGGLLLEEDFRNYHASIEEPILGTYRGYSVYKCGFWTQGPFMLQTLNILEGYDLSKMNPHDPEYIHLVIEAMKLALADRDTYYADPDFVEVPAEPLLSKKYARKRRELIHHTKASLEYRPGGAWENPPLLEPNIDRLIEPHDTTTCVVADRLGNMFVATPSGWGSGVPPGETGIELGTRLQSFNTWEGHPNKIEPGKRPRITLTPTLIEKDGNPFMAVSVAGGDQQDQTAIQLVLNVIDFGLSAQQSADITRFGTNQLVGSFCQTPVEYGSLLIENKAPKETKQALKKKGHILQLRESFPSAAVLLIWHGNGLFEPAGDMHKRREILAWA